MDVVTLMTVGGAIITVGITVNGFFLKGIMTSLGTMQVELARVIVKIENYSGRIDTLEHGLRKLELNHMECRGQCESTNIKS